MHKIINNKNFTNNLKEFKKIIKADPDIIIIKNFCSIKICKEITKKAHNFSKKNQPYSKQSGVDYNKILGTKNFWEYRVLPITSETSHLYRIFHINFYNKFFKDNPISLFFKNYLSLLDIICDKPLLKSKKMKINPKIIHYPLGGGHFDWHIHNRYPQNYGKILNLSKQNTDFKKGSTLFKIKNKIISFEKITKQGDLVLFKYNLPHMVSKVDHNSDLIFNLKGRWTLVMPIY